MIQNRLPFRWVSIYFVNLALLFASQVDIAYLRAWDQYGLRMPIFATIYFLLSLFFLYGLIEIVRGTKAGIYFSFGLALLGLTPLSITIYFLLKRNIVIHPYNFYVIVQASLFGLSIAHATFVALLARKYTAQNSSAPIFNPKSKI
ncbi:MAG: hypothetical protein AB1750_12010 [Chloroflexota bacterium]